MTARAYVDSSCIVAVALRELTAKDVIQQLREFAELSSNPLLDAEVRAACAREHVPLPAATLETIKWTQMTRPLSSEIDRVLSAGYLRGADCLHVATALYLSPDPEQLTFMTLDLRQRAVADTLGFKT
ncbi:MAG: hypothetical protein V4550_13150 [Gemmatimonadota bacterium]